jgi:biotin synthase
MTRLDRLYTEGIEALDDAELHGLLFAAGAEQEELFRRAREVRRECHGDRVVLRGVIEVSNRCRKSCEYCAMRTANGKLHRYGLDAGEILAAARQIGEAGIRIVFLQGGEDPGSDPLFAEVIPVIRRELGLGVLLCLGERPLATYGEFARLGADSYILKFETSDPDLYLRTAHTPLEERLAAIDRIRGAGLRLGTGNIVGLPHQTEASLVADLRLGARLKPDFISSSPFVPNADTPLCGHPHGSVARTLNTLAIWRVALKTPLIPSVSALENLCASGQRMGLDAGANVLTVNFTPGESQSLYRIYSARRFVVSLDHALRTIEAAGLRVSGA